MQVGSESGYFRKNRVGPGRMAECKQKIVKFLNAAIN